jgi:3-dehydroquinate synthase
MPNFRVETAQGSYDVVVARGAIAQAARHLPSKAGKVFVVSEENVMRRHGERLSQALADIPHTVLSLPGCEENKRLGPLERLAEQMVQRGGDRNSVVVAFGGGIVGDMAGFLAAIFMRGIPVLQIPTTLLAQVDAAIGGKTGVNLACGKNLIGSFHQPVAVLIDPALLDTLADREYRAGIYEIVKAGIIRDPKLFRFLRESSKAVIERSADAVDQIIADSVRIKVEVVSADEREGDVRRILNFGHTFGHALEAETGYTRFLHGEAVAWGMRAATRLAQSIDRLNAEDSARIFELLDLYGPIPPLDGLDVEGLFRRLAHDKKTVRGIAHFVLPVRIGEVAVVGGVEDELVRAAIRRELV